MTNSIEVLQLSKKFGNQTVIDHLSFKVEAGSFFSLLGTNGAGKSTTIAILLTLLKPDAGKVFVSGNELGKDDDKIRQSVGIVFQKNLLDPLLTVYENLHFRCAFYGMSKTKSKAAIDRVVEIGQLQAFLNRKYRNLSGGEKRRADIARALLHTPTILILDEPTTGLDVESRRHIWKMLLQLQQETKMTILLTTHYIEEASISDSIVIMDQGKIIAEGTPEQLTNQFANSQLRIYPIEKDLLETEFNGANLIYTVENDSLCIDLDETIDALPILQKYGDNIQSFEVKKASLDDVFLSVTGKEVLSDDSFCQT